MEYIGGPQEAGCLFCRVRDAPESEDRRNLVVWRAPQATVMMNKFPYNNGHLMIAPHAHVGSLVDLGDDELLALGKEVKRALSVLAGLMAPEGFNCGVNIGKVAGAGIPDHVHYHVVPRWNGDTNFLPVLSEVKVINEHLDQTWEHLAEAFRGGG